MLNKRKRPRRRSLLRIKVLAPSLASLRHKYPQASVQELKKKLLMELASQLDDIQEDDIMSTSSKSQAPSNTQDPINPDEEEEEEEASNENEDIDNHMGI